MSNSVVDTTTIEQLAGVISRATTDPAYRSTLLGAPAATLQSAGIALPSDMALQVAENSSTLMHLVLPSATAELPAEAQQELASLAASGAAPASPLDAWARTVIDAWQSGDLKAKLVSDPAAVLAEAGVTLPPGVSLRTLEASDSLSWLVLPPAASASAAASTTATPATVGTVASSITSSFSNLTKLITAGSYIAGLGFSIGAIMKFKQHKDNPTQIPIGTPIALLLVGAALLFVPEIETTTGQTQV
jgi:intracellular multiplication protein IcmD